MPDCSGRAATASIGAERLGASGVVGGRANTLLLGRDACRARRRALAEELEETERRHDLGRIDRLRDEIGAIERALAMAYGIGGHGRRTGTPCEGARKAVYNRLRQAIRRIGQHDAALGRHLAVSIRTERVCGYIPDRALTWRTER